jgi:putative tricarboxylic transport membrane protein
MAAPTVDGAAPPATRRPVLGPRIVGAVLAVAGLSFGYVALRELDGEGVTVGGPRFAPLAVTGAWTALALMYLVGQLVRPSTVDHEDQAVEASTVDGSAVPTGGPPHRLARLSPALLFGALLGYVALLEPLGFALASTGFFVAAARILGSGHWLRDVLVAVALAFGAYLAFTRLLDIQLPAGVLPL